MIFIMFLEGEHVLKLPPALPGLTQDACPGPCVCSRPGPCPAGYIAVLWVPRGSCAVPWRGPAGTCPREGLLHSPGAGSCESPAYAGAVPLPRPCSGPALPEELPCGPLPCLGVFEPEDDSDLHSLDLFTEPGQSGRSVRRHSWHRGGRAVPGVPLACGWLCHQLPCSCRGQRRTAAPLTEQGEPLGRDVPGLSRQTHGCCSPAGHLRLLYPLPAASAPPLLLPFLSLDAVQPHLCPICARATAVPVSRGRLRRLAAGTRLLRAGLVELMPLGFLGNKATSQPAWKSSSANSAQAPRLSSESLLYLQASSSGDDP